jgi:hypothetical protein
MTSLTRSVTLALFLISSVAVAGETISTVELQSFFYADGRMEKSEPRFEMTYFVEGDTVTRTRVYDKVNKEVIPDDTQYAIVRGLSSDPQNPLSSMRGISVIRAVGSPGSDAVEVIVIGSDFVQTVKSTRNYFVISRQKRIQ